MMKIVVLLAVILAINWNFVFGEELAPYLKVCSRNDKDLAQCIKRAIDGLKPIFVNGDPSRDVPSLEPLDVGDLLIGNFAGGAAVGIKVSATNILARGASNFDITKISADFETLTFNFEVFLPHIEAKGNYNIDGNILLLPIRGNGPFTANFTNSTGKALLTGKTFVRDGKNILNADKMNIKIKLGKGNIDLRNLFGGDKTLGNIINQTINSNIEILSTEIVPLIEKALSKLFIRIANQIIDRYTFEQLYPE
ncbi:protein takeout-like [Ctenocephalides felis]|uniref:protein takeout-like n=1 Tax=Ctenocephalides felis TaxID=7515 RepID=UPI000E6E4D9C|nr:protein takeout-like [Ctenocephalides felis]